MIIINWRKYFIFIAAGNIGLFAAVLFLLFIVSDKCLDLGGRVGQTWAECEFPVDHVAAWADYVGVGPIVIGFVIWMALWAFSQRLICKIFSRGK